MAARYDVTADLPLHATITVLEPDEGWTRACFDREMAHYARARGARPRTVTRHPETMAALGLVATWAMGTMVAPVRGPMLVPSTSYPRDRVTLYAERKLPSR